MDSCAGLSDAFGKFEHFGVFVCCMNAQHKTIEAFRELVLSTHYDSFSVQDIVRRAGIARSTFYAHFRDKDHLLTVSLRPILEVLAQVVQGRGEADTVQTVMQHIWENRLLGRVFFQPPLVGRIARTLLSEMDDPHHAASVFRLHGTLGLLGNWCEGRVHKSPAQLTQFLLEQHTQSTG